MAYIRLLNTANTSQGGPGGFFQNIARYSMLLVSAVIGLVILALTASAAIVVVLSLLFIALVVFAFFWVRAKVFGKPIGGKAFADMQAQMRAQQDAATRPSRSTPDDFDGETIDAHKTPDGWSVDE